MHRTESGAGAGGIKYGVLERNLVLKVCMKQSSLIPIIPKLLHVQFSPQEVKEPIQKACLNL